MCAYYNNYYNCDPFWLFLQLLLGRCKVCMHAMLALHYLSQEVFKMHLLLILSDPPSCLGRWRRKKAKCMIQPDRGLMAGIVIHEMRVLVQGAEYDTVCERARNVCRTFQRFVQIRLICCLPVGVCTLTTTTTTTTSCTSYHTSTTAMDRQEGKLSYK